MKNMPIIQPISKPVTTGKGVFKRLKSWFCYKRKWLVVKDYVTFCPKVGRNIMVPKGFELDFASVPALFHIFPALAPTGLLLAGSVPHDYIYKNGCILLEHGDAIKVTRKQGDIILRSVGDYHTGATATNTIAYFGVRLCGWLHYKK